MAPTLINVFNISDSGTLELAGASYVTTAAVGGVTYVFVASRIDDGVSVFSLGADGTLTPVFDFADNALTSLAGAFALTTAVVGGTTYLYTAAITEYGLTGFSVGANGALTVVANVPDDATLQLALTTDVEAAVVGGTTYLFAGGVNDSGVSVFSVAANGALTNVDNVVDDATARIAGPQGMTTAVVGGTTYLFVTGFHDDGVGVYAVAPNGHLTNVFNVTDAGPLELDGPVDVITAVVGGTTYLFVTGFEDDGISVFSVAANGALTNVFNLPDDGLLELDNPVGMSVAVLGGTTYLFVVGADDDGLSVFKVAANGALTNVANVTDAGDLELDRPIGVTTVVVNGQIHVIVASNFDDGVSTFIFDDGINEQPTLTATGHNPAFAEGGAAVDLFGAPVASTVEPGQNFTSLILTVTNVTDGANEILSFLGNDIALTNGSAVAGVTVSVAGTTATVTFPGAANAAALQALVDSLAYRNTSQNPTGADRVITITSLTDSGGTADGGHDTAALNIVSTVNVNPANNAAIITGDTAGGVTEAGAVDNGTPTATGNLDATDADNANDAWQAVAAGTASQNGFGSYALNADGTWTYTLDNTNAAVQALNGADTLTDSFVALTADGTSQTVTITIHAQNDAAAITGDAAGTVTESGLAGAGIATDSGDLASTDADSANDAWQVVAAGTASANGFGTYEMTAAGEWTYTLDNDNAAVQALNGADTLTDTFMALTADGTAQLVTVTIRAQNDAAVITGTATGDVTEAGSLNGGTPAATGNLDSADVDNPDDVWSAVAAGTASIGGFGSYQVAANGQWSYTLDNANAAVQALNGAATLIDTFRVVTADGTTQLVSITIHAQNDAATITGDAAGSVTESGIGDSGDLNATDPDNAIDSWQAVAAGAATANGFGSYALSASGVWTYTLDNDNGAVQALNGADTLTDSFTALTADGTAQIVTVTIHAQNDAAIITGTTTGDVTEAGGFNNSSPGTPTATGNLDSTDVDNPDDAWTVVAAGTASIGGFGTYQVTADGHWTYTLDNANPAVQANTATTDTFSVVTADGTARLVTITIHPQNDAAIIGGTAAGAVTEAGGVANGAPGTPAATGDLAATDPDNPNDTWQAVAAGASALGYGTYQLGVDGVWTYTLDDSNAAVQALNAGATLFDAFTALTADGTGREVAITIHGRNDAAIITGDAIGAVAEAGNGPGTPTDSGDLNAADVDNAADAWHAVVAGATVNGYGTYGLTAVGVWTYTLDNDNAAVQALQGGEKLTDSFTALAADGTARVVTVTIDGQDDPHSDPGPAVMTGSPGPDSFAVPSGDSLINALTGLDTVTFDFRLVDATVTYQGNKVVIDGPNSHTVLTGAERFIFKDGTVDNNDGNPLVDDLFYYSKNHDVWNAHADADAHFDTFGRHEHRDPNAFFSTDIYLSVSPEARAAGGNPLSYFDAIGWQAGIPSLAFDPAAYLAANPDVAAAHVDPLRHYLQFGYQEGRQPVAPTESLTAEGFDFVFYLTHNPDVAAAHIDPLQHFRTFGWQEGRDPNGLFDTSGYLAAYADVKAAGINPLDHFNQFGWREGRDPSADFDTSDYLAAYPDVAAAHVNPLVHYLQHGIHEGRSAFADGVFG